MDIVVDIESAEPLFAQLVEQIKAAVKSGGLKPSDALPSIRQLANDLDINNKTVAKAYKILERDSIIETKGYRGTFVHRDALVNTSFNVNDLVFETLKKTILACREAGATDSEIRIAFTNAMHQQKRSM